MRHLGFVVLLLASPLAAQQAAPRVAPKVSASVTAALVASGDSIFHGMLAGGACLMCHGVDAKGTPGLAPNLTDDKWLDADGSLESIVAVITQGVASPRESPAPMPPMGGANLTPAQVRAVAAYVYWLSHKGTP